MEEWEGQQLGVSPNGKGSARQPERIHNTTMDANRGAVFCATGSFNYLEAALISSLALRKHEPTLPITLLSNIAGLEALDLEGTGIAIRQIAPELSPGSEAFASRWIKTQLASLSPYRVSLYVDADMLTMQPLGQLWQALDQFPIGLVPDRLPLVSQCDHVAAEEKVMTLATLGGDATHFNSGLILWRSSEEARNLFAHWHQQWCHFERHDQLALARAIHRSGVNVKSLPSSYNTSPRDARGRSVHLLHRWGGTVSRGIFRRFAAAHQPAVVAEAQRRLQSLPIP
jgi:hypothetical protein